MTTTLVDATIERCRKSLKDLDTSRRLFATVVDSSIERGEWSAAPTTIFV